MTARCMGIAGWGRHTDPSPVCCQRCGWISRVRDAVHGYQSDGAGDVEGYSECPRCGSTGLDNEFVPEPYEPKP